MSTETNIEPNQNQENWCIRNLTERFDIEQMRASFSSETGFYGLLKVDANNRPLAVVVLDEALSVSFEKGFPEHALMIGNVFFLERERVKAYFKNVSGRLLVGLVESGSTSFIAFQQVLNPQKPVSVPIKWKEDWEFQKPKQLFNVISKLVFRKNFVGNAIVDQQTYDAWVEEKREVLGVNQGRLKLAKAQLAIDHEFEMFRNEARVLFKQRR